jgi:nitrogen fixation/metabolism regulation signal transduction histidine kinase
MLFLGVLHLLLTYLLYLRFQDQKMWFILSEILILLSLVLAFHIYQVMVRPLRFITDGINALEDQDFTVRYRTTNSVELNQLIHFYNGLIDNIREERIELEEQHYFLERLIQAYPTGVIILDYEGQITDFNPRAASIFGVTLKEVQGQSLSFIAHPLILIIQDMAVGTNQLVKLHGAQRFKCEVAQFLHRGFYRRFIMVHEVTNEILLAEKQAYGKVIRMMAHEVNNSMGATGSILNVVRDYLLEMGKAGDEEMAEALALAIKRHDSLNQFMKNFAEVVRLPRPELKWMNVADLLRQVVDFMRPNLQAVGIQIHFDDSEASGVRKQIDAQQFEQALVNVLKNAREAIGQNGQIKVNLYNHPLRIVIADNGKGINPEIEKQLFTPFFSTKPDGQGVGLTLVREIIHNHAARIDLKSRPDGWTYCTISF